MCSEASEGGVALELFCKVTAMKYPFYLLLMGLRISDGISGAEVVKQLLNLDSSARGITSSDSAIDPIPNVIYTVFPEYCANGLRQKVATSDEV